jgi:multiple antibiotic resistance protein
VGGGLLRFTITAFTSIFIIVDPLGNVPVFLGLTGDYDEERRRQASRTASLTCFGVLSAFSVAGPE